MENILGRVEVENRGASHKPRYNVVRDRITWETTGFAGDCSRVVVFRVAMMSSDSSNRRHGRDEGVGGSGGWDSKWRITGSSALAGLGTKVKKDSLF